MRERLALFLGLIGGGLVLLAIYLTFFVTPTIVTAAEQSDFAQKIFYLHTPVAETSLLSFLVAAVAGVLYLGRRQMVYDILGSVAIELGLVFGVLVEFSGVIWNRTEWGVWWDWDPKLTVYLITLLFFAAYFLLRSSVAEEEPRARYAAVYAIVGSVSVPLTFFANRVIPGVHPVLFRLGQQIDPSVAATFGISMIGMALVYVALLITRVSIEEMRWNLEAVKDRIGG